MSCIIKTYCYKCRLKVEVIELEILNNGVFMSLKCGHKTRKFWKQDF